MKIPTGLVAIAIVVAGGCASDAQSSAPSSLAASSLRPQRAAQTSAPQSSVAPTTTEAAPVPTGPMGFFGAQTAACATDLEIVRTAVDTFMALNPSVPVSETAMVEAQVLREESVFHDVDPSGTVLPSPTGGCAA